MHGGRQLLPARAGRLQQRMLRRGGGVQGWGDLLSAERPGLQRRVLPERFLRQPGQLLHSSVPQLRGRVLRALQLMLRQPVLRRYLHEQRYLLPARTALRGHLLSSRARVQQRHLFRVRFAAGALLFDRADRRRLDLLPAERGVLRGQVLRSEAVADLHFRQRSGDVQ